jgi:hypothetical protein
MRGAAGHGVGSLAVPGLPEYRASGTRTDMCESPVEVILRRIGEPDVDGEAGRHLADAAGTIDESSETRHGPDVGYTLAAQTRCQRRRETAARRRI